jgi:hypothetical protein
MSDDLSEIAKQGLEPIGEIVKRVAGPLADEIGESLAVLARPYRNDVALHRSFVFHQENSH